MTAEASEAAVTFSGQIRRAVTGTRRSVSADSALVLTVIGICVLGTLLSPTFLTVSNARNVMLNVAILGVLALGQTLVMLLRQIDLSVGSLLAFAPIVAIKLAEIVHGISGKSLIEGGNYVVTGTGLIIALTLLVGTLMGVLSGVITVKGKVPSLIVTLGMLYALRGATYSVSGGHSLYLTDLNGFRWIGSATFFGFIPVSFLMFLMLGTLAIVALKHTKIGPRIYAIGGNENGAMYAGIKTGRWKILAFAFSGFCAGLAALFFSSRLASVEAAQGTGFELQAIAIAVVGGTTLIGGRGKMFRTILASIVVALIINIIASAGLVVWYQTVIVGLIIVGAALAYRERAGSWSPS